MGDRERETRQDQGPREKEINNVRFGETQGYHLKGERLMESKLALAKWQ